MYDNYYTTYLYVFNHDSQTSLSSSRFCSTDVSYTNSLFILSPNISYIQVHVIHSSEIIMDSSYGKLWLIDWPGPHPSITLDAINVASVYLLSAFLMFVVCWSHYEWPEGKSPVPWALLVTAALTYWTSEVGCSQEISVCVYMKLTVTCKSTVQKSVFSKQ